MSRIDIFTGNAIGCGEVAAYQILKKMFGLERRFHEDWPEDGIYTQIPLLWVLSGEWVQFLAPWHKKNSIDIVIIKNRKPIAIRVNGWTHFGGFKRHKRGIPQGLKRQRDEAQFWMMYESGIPVIDFNVNEMPELFKDNVNEKSIKEIDYFLKMWFLAYISYILKKKHL